jgi:hypothetical protein
MQERLTLGVVGSNPVRYLNERRVCIADRLRSFEYSLLHHGGFEAWQESMHAGCLPTTHNFQQCSDWCGSKSNVRGLQLPSNGNDSVELLEDYLANLVLITSVSKHCSCRLSASASTGLSSTGKVLSEFCQHKAGEYVMAQDLVPGLRYDPLCVVELSDIHGFGLTSTALGKALPLFCNLRRLNLSRNRLVTVCGLGLESMAHLKVGIIG